MLRTILLPFHDEQASRTALDAAALIATRYGSYVEGLLVQEGPHFAVTPGLTMPADYLSTAAEEWRRFADSARRQFAAGAEAYGLDMIEPESEAPGPVAGWREMEGREADVVGPHGRVFDLIVIGRTGADPATRWQDTCESALFDSGRPVLVASAAKPEVLGESVVIAWNGSTETARTVALGMPLLADAKSVVVLTVEGATFPGPSGAEVATHLTRNGIPARAVTADPAGRTPGETIIEEADALGADLLLKGAFTRARLRQLIFGGATQHVLDNAPVPVLMAH